MSWRGKRPSMGSRTGCTRAHPTPWCQWPRGLISLPSLADRGSKADRAGVKLLGRDRLRAVDPEDSGARDGDAVVPVYVAHVDAAAGSLVDGVAREAPGEFLERDPGLQARERGADAIVDALSESQLRRDVAPDVEPVGVGVLPLVPVGGAEQEQDAIPRRDPAAIPFDVSRDRPYGVLGRRRPAQHLLDGAGNRARVGQDAGVLIRVAREQDGGEAEQPGGRLAPGGAEQRAEADDLAIGEARRPA